MNFQKAALQICFKNLLKVMHAPWKIVDILHCNIPEVYQRLLPPQGDVKFHRHLMRCHISSPHLTRHQSVKKVRICSQVSCKPGSSNRERREGGADLLFDHGCQYFTVKDPSIQAMVDRWLEAGIVADWTGCFGTLDARSGEFVEVRNGAGTAALLPPFFLGLRGIRIRVQN